MAGKPPYFPFYPNDFAADGKVESMTTEEVGAYILLLCKAWLEDPCGTIPDDDSVLARWTRTTPARWKKIKANVLAPFRRGPVGRLSQKRMLQEAARFASISEKRQQAAEKKWAKQHMQNTDAIPPPVDGANADANAMQMHPVCMPFADANGMHSRGRGRASDSDSGSESASSSSGKGVSGEGETPARSDLPAHNPDLVPLAEAVIAHYQAAVKSANPRNAEALTNVIARLKDGHSVEDLRRSAEAYGAVCDQQGQTARHRQGVGKFYAQHSAYQDYLGGVPKVASAAPKTKDNFAEQLREGIKQQGKPP